jgi:predicted NBD/HSP70 family sugar kinase
VPDPCWPNGRLVCCQPASSGRNVVQHLARYVGRTAISDERILAATDASVTFTYDRRYCQRGEMEIRVKEQMMLFADRVSAQRWWINQWRFRLSALAYTLVEALRRMALTGTELAQATCATIPAKLIKIGAVVVKKLTIVRLHLSSHHPLQDP